MKTDNQSRIDPSLGEGLLTSPGRNMPVSSGNRRDSFSIHQTITGGDSKGVAELEMENARLQRLIAELLITNQKLRQNVLRLQEKNGMR
jgi:hypothetical protein